MERPAVYDDLDLLFEQVGGSYQVRVSQSPSGDTPRQSFRPPFSDVQLENLALTLQRHRGSGRRLAGPEIDLVKGAGGDLYEALFHDDLGACLHRSLAVAETRGHGLRIRLALSGGPALALPWELMFDRGLGQFVALSRGTSVVRYLPGAPIPAPFEAGLPLRILVVTSDPADQDRLEVGSQRDDVLTALRASQRDGQLEIDFLPAATLAALQQALREGDYHVFHFIGRGGFDETGHEAALVLEDGDGHGSPVGGPQIGALLSDHRSLRLAVLNSVSGGRSDWRDPGAAVAQALLRRGVPAVVTMQFELTHAAATVFAGSLYPAIAAGLSADAALAEARAAIYGALNPVEWATPVLHTGSPHGVLFLLRPGSLASTGASGRAAADINEVSGPAPVVDEDVQFTVYRPQTLTPEQWATMVVFAHKTTLLEEPGRPPLDPVADVEARARAQFGGSPPRPISGDARQGLPRGSQLRIAPDLPGIECNPEAAEVKWWEPVHEVGFRLRARAGRAGSVVHGAVRVWSGPLILGEVSIAIRVTATGEQAASSPPVGEQVQRYRKIFPSYSHQDRSFVENFAMLARATGDQYLQDVLTLRAGEQWDARLLQLIDEADMFQLFWSHNSMRSPHCRDEWEHALALRRDTFIRPVYWEDPLPEDPAQQLPPARLRELHFVKVPPVLPAPLRAGPVEPAGTASQAQPGPRRPPAGTGQPTPTPETVPSGPGRTPTEHPAPPSGAGDGGGPLVTADRSTPPARRRGRSRWLQAAAGLAAVTGAAVVALGVTSQLGSSHPASAPAASGSAPGSASGSGSGSGSGSATGPPATAGPLTYRQLRPGDCLTGQGLRLGATGSWPAIVLSVPCDQGHLAEVIYVADHWPKSRAYPGGKKLSALAAVRCDRAFRSYVGIPRSRSRFEVTQIVPSPGGWDSGDRRLTCVAYKPARQETGAATLFSSIRGSGS